MRLVKTVSERQSNGANAPSVTNQNKNFRFLLLSFHLNWSKPLESFLRLFNCFNWKWQAVVWIRFRKYNLRTEVSWVKIWPHRFFFLEKLFQSKQKVCFRCTKMRFPFPSYHVRQVMDHGVQAVDVTLVPRIHVA